MNSVHGSGQREVPAVMPACVWRGGGLGDDLTVAEVQTNHLTMISLPTLLRFSGPTVCGFSQWTQCSESGLQNCESPDPDWTQKCGDGSDGGDAALMNTHTHTHTFVFPSNSQTGSRQ